MEKLWRLISLIGLFVLLTFGAYASGQQTCTFNCANFWCYKITAKGDCYSFSDNMCTAGPIWSNTAMVADCTKVVDINGVGVTIQKYKCPPANCMEECSMPYPYPETCNPDVFGCTPLMDVVQYNCKLKGSK